MPTVVTLRLVDKYGNVVESGGVRVDGKCFGSKASECQVVDCNDGTYTITFVASVRLQINLNSAHATYPSAFSYSYTPILC